jgi:hypothetical protein
MFSVGMDVDKFVSTEKKNLLYAGNFCCEASNPLIFIMLGKIYSRSYNATEQSAGNFNFSTLPRVARVARVATNILTLDNFWLAGFTQADGCFHISIAKSKTHKTGFSVRLEFSLKQNDQIPLKLLYDLVKLGNLSQYTPPCRSRYASLRHLACAVATATGRGGIWCYKSSGFKTASRSDPGTVLIKYFDTFNLFGRYCHRQR